MKNSPKQSKTTAIVIPSHDFKKAIEAIAVKPLSGKLTLLSRKLFNCLLASAQDQGIDKETFSISLDDLISKYAQFDSHDTQLVKDHLRKMAQTSVEWSSGVKGVRRWGVSHLLSDVEIIESGRRCSIEWSYSSKVKNKLLLPDVFARMSLQFQKSFRSAEALALYEICVRYIDSPGKATLRMPWEEWRPRLTGTPDQESKTYKVYKYFKRALKEAVEEVNNLTDIVVTIREFKEGRTVKDIKFEVERKTQSSLPLNEPNLFDMTIVTRLVALGFTQPQAESIYSNNEETTIRRALDYTESGIKKKTVMNPAGFFKSSLASGWGDKPPGLIEGEKHKEPKKQAKVQPAREELIATLKQKWWAMRRDDAMQTFQAQSESKRQSILDDFSATLTMPLLKYWKKQGVNNAMVGAAFTKWLTQNLQEPSDAEIVLFGVEQGLVTGI